MKRKVFYIFFFIRRLDDSGGFINVFLNINKKRRKRIFSLGKEFVCLTAVCCVWMRNFCSWNRLECASRTFLSFYRFLFSSTLNVNIIAVTLIWTFAHFQQWTVLGSKNDDSILCHCHSKNDQLNKNQIALGGYGEGF